MTLDSVCALHYQQIQFWKKKTNAQSAQGSISISLDWSAINLLPPSPANLIFLGTKIYNTLCLLTRFSALTSSLHFPCNKQISEVLCWNNTFPNQSLCILDFNFNTLLFQIINDLCWKKGTKTAQLTKSALDLHNNCNILPRAIQTWTGRAISSVSLAPSSHWQVRLLDRF